MLYRNLQGKVCLADAYCPHLGAHLGHGGQVEQCDADPALFLPLPMKALPCLLVDALKGVCAEEVALSLSEILR